MRARVAKHLNAGVAKKLESQGSQKKTKGNKHTWSVAKKQLQSQGNEKHLKVWTAKKLESPRSNTI